MTLKEQTSACFTINILSESHERVPFMRANDVWANVQKVRWRHQMQRKANAKAAAASDGEILCKKISHRSLPVTSSVNFFTFLRNNFLCVWCKLVQFCGCLPTSEHFLLKYFSIPFSWDQKPTLSGGWFRWGWWPRRGWGGGWWTIPRWGRIPARACPWICQERREAKVRNIRNKYLRW